MRFETVKNIQKPVGSKKIPIQNVGQSPIISTKSSNKNKIYAPKSTNIYKNLKHVKGNDLEEILKECGMDFNARKENLSYKFNDKQMEVPDKVSVVRGDTGHYLGVVGSTRSIIQFRDALSFTEVFANEGESTYEYGGTTHHGRVAYLVMKSDDCFEICPGDPIDNYFYVQTSHDSSKSLMIVPTPIRRGNNSVFVHPDLHAVKIKHTKHAALRLVQARKGLEKIKDYFKEFEESFRSLATVKLDTKVGGDTIKDRYLRMVFPDGKEKESRAINTREKVEDILLTDPSLKTPPTQNTLLGAYFAVVFFCDHYLTVKKTKGRDEVTAQIESKISIDGASARRKAESFAAALKLKEKLNV